MSIDIAPQIIITVGPASRDPDVQRQMLALGVRHFRFALSKEPPAQVLDHIRQLRQIADQQDVAIEIIVDTPGTKPRLHNDQSIDIVASASVTFGNAALNRPRNASSLVSCDLAELLARGLCHGDVIVTGDGELGFEVLDIDPEVGVRTRALNAGCLGPRRGWSIDGGDEEHSKFSMAELEALAQDPLLHACDALMLSFVDNGRAAKNAAKLIGKKIYTKIETRTAINHMPDIATHSDVIILARGDLFLATGVVDFFEYEERVIDSCLSLSIPVVAATQLLPSVSSSYLPSRSEVSYLSYLYARGIDGIMFSAETTVGSRPLDTIVIAQQLQRKYRDEP